MSQTNSALEPPRLQGGEVDTHVHATKLPEKGIDTIHALQTSFDAGLCACIDIGISEGDIVERSQTLHSFDRLYFAHGLYPSNASRDDIQSALVHVRDACTGERVCAVGEIGIDRHWDYATPELQKRLFAEQIEMANELELPIVVHNREAEKDILDVLKSVRPHRESVMHCYGGPAEYVQRFLDYGFSVSFGGNVTFKNADALRDALTEVPDDRLLLETDAPFLAPHPRRGKPNYPGLLGYTYDAVALHRGIARDTLTALMQRNSRRVFGIHVE